MAQRLLRWMLLIAARRFADAATLPPALIIAGLRYAPRHAMLLIRACQRYAISPTACCCRCQMPSLRFALIRFVGAAAAYAALFTFFRHYAGGAISIRLRCRLRYAPCRHALCRTPFFATFR